MTAATLVIALFSFLAPAEPAPFVPISEALKTKPQLRLQEQCYSDSQCKRPVPCGALAKSKRFIVKGKIGPCMKTKPIRQGPYGDLPQTLPG